MFISPAVLLAALSLAAPTLAATSGTRTGPDRMDKRAACPSASPSPSTVYKPKVMIVSMFGPERAVWLSPLSLNYNVTPQVIGMSPLFPDISCNHAGTVCIYTTGEAEINAAATTMAVMLAPQLDLSSTYFLIAGIAGVNPYLGTLATAAFARFAVQVALMYEIDARQIPAGWTTGYWALGTKAPGQLPPVSHLYGTEVFELNTNLLSKALSLTKGLKLNDSTGAIAYRAKFDYAPANLPPAVTSCDVATSDVYYAGTLLSESFGNYTSLMTKGQGAYCMTAQEDNATLESMVRAHKAGLMDYSRVILLRTASDFDRAPPGNIAAYDAFEASQGGFTPATQNLVIAGLPVVNDILNNWSSVYAPGIPTQYQGDGSFYGDDLATIRSGAAQARI